MRVSLSEIQVCINKACLATGLHPGLAEDAGRSARHAIGSGFGCLDCFSRAIDEIDRKRSVTYNADKALLGYFESHLSPKVLSALYGAPAVFDLMLLNWKQDFHFRKGNEINIVNVDVPALIIFESLVASIKLDNKVSVFWKIMGKEHASGFSHQGSLILQDGSIDEVFGASFASMTINVVKFNTEMLKYLNPVKNVQDLFNINEQTWDNIIFYANRTLVESTKESRMKGAGAGVIDRD